MPSAGVRFAGETAFLILVALGLGLAEFDPVVIGVVMFLAWVLVALLERASSKEAARATEAEQALAPAPPAHVERVDVERAADASVQEPVAEPEQALEPTVSERSARAILASGPPPLPPEPARPEKKKPARRRLERRPEPKAEPPPPPPPEAEPELEPAVRGPAREWNLWEVQRAVRDAPDDERQEEWTALLIHLREFANADGDLPIEFDALVRESFANVLASEREPATAT